MSSGSYDLRIYNPEYLSWGAFGPVTGQWLTKQGVSGTAVVSGSTGTTTLEIGPDNLGTFQPDQGSALSEFTASPVTYTLCFAGVTLAGARECAQIVDFTVAANAPSASNVGICTVDATGAPCDDPAQAANALRVRFDEIYWGEETASFYYIVELSTGVCATIRSGRPPA